MSDAAFPPHNWDELSDTEKTLRLAQFIESVRGS
jgi:hypothetical protein